MTDVRECWDCGGDLFRIVTDDERGLVAECDGCGGRMDPSMLYASGDSHDRECFDVSMEVA